MVHGCRPKTKPQKPGLQPQQHQQQRYYGVFRSWLPQLDPWVTSLLPKAADTGSLPATEQPYKAADHEVVAEGSVSAWLQRTFLPSRRDGERQRDVENSHPRHSQREPGLERLQNDVKHEKTHSHLSCWRPAAGRGYRRLEEEEEDTACRNDGEAGQNDGPKRHKHRNSRKCSDEGASVAQACQPSWFYSALLAHRTGSNTEHRAHRYDTRPHSLSLSSPSSTSSSSPSPPPTSASKGSSLSSLSSASSLEDGLGDSPCHDSRRRRSGDLSSPNIDDGLSAASSLGSLEARHQQTEELSAMDTGGRPESTASGEEADGQPATSGAAPSSTACHAFSSTASHALQTIDSSSAFATSSGRLARFVFY
jgi:hypothetical protein